MEIQKDFKELLELFNAQKVEYLIVGGYTFSFHLSPFFSKEGIRGRAAQRGFGAGFSIPNFHGIWP